MRWDLKESATVVWLIFVKQTLLGLNGQIFVFIHSATPPVMWGASGVNSLAYSVLFVYASFGPDNQSLWLYIHSSFCFDIF